jgi:hypothetical protein
MVTRLTTFVVRHAPMRGNRRCERKLAANCHKPLAELINGLNR